MEEEKSEAERNREINERVRYRNETSKKIISLCGVLGCVIGHGCYRGWGGLIGGGIFGLLVGCYVVVELVFQKRP